MSRTKTKLSALLCLTVIMSLILAACGGGKGSSSSSAKKDDVLNIMESATIPTADSVMAQDVVGFTVLDQVMEGLMRLGEGDKTVLGMASAQPTTNDDKTVYTFKLRDAKWSNGDAVTANDFVYAWQKAIDPATASPYGAYMMGGVIKNASEIAAKKKKPAELGVKALDDKTLQVTLERPVPYFVSLMTFPLFFPQDEKFVKSKGKKYASNSDSLVYNGPYVLTKWNGTGDSWTYEKNKDYWDKDTVKLSKINVNVVSDPSTAVNLFNTGKLDRSLLSGEFAGQYKNNKNYQNVLDPSVFYLMMNQKNNGKVTPLANENIRKAISMAFDKETLVDSILNNGSAVANGLLPKDFVKDPDTGEDFRKENGDLSTYNASEAKKYWEKGLKELGKSSITLNYLGDDTESAKKIGEFMQNQLQTNLKGLTVKLQQVPFKVRLSRQDNAQYDISMSGWGPDYLDPYTFSNLFLTGSDQNHMSYSNKKYDQLVTDANTTLSAKPTDRWKNLLEAEKLLVQDDAAIAPVYQKGIANLQQPYVKGIIKHAFGPEYSYKWAYIKK